MNVSSFRPRLLGSSLLVAAAIAFGATVPAFADGSSTVVVTGGTLTGGNTTLGNLTGATIDGVLAKTATATWAISDFDDATGTGAGWHSSLTLSQFAEYDTVGHAYVSGGHTLATSSLTVVTAPIAAATGTGLAASGSASAITPITTTTALDTAAPVKLLSAAAQTASATAGMGTFTISSMDTSLAIPVTAYAATYEADGTVSIVAGP